MSYIICTGICCYGITQIRRIQCATFGPFHFRQSCPFNILERSAHRCTCTTPPFTSILLASINRNMSGNIHSFAPFSVIYFTPQTRYFLEYSKQEIKFSGQNIRAQCLTRIWIRIRDLSRPKIVSPIRSVSAIQNTRFFSVFQFSFRRHFGSLASGYIKNTVQ